MTEANPAPVYLMVNTRAKPAPTETLYANDWIAEAFRIYDGTPLAHISELGFWLILLKPSSYRELGKVMDNGIFSDPSWGWAYRSNIPLQDNLDHWRRRQIVTHNGDSVILRLGDSRVAAVLIPAMNKDDWRLLMTPVQQVLINTPELKVFSSPAANAPLPDPEILYLPFEVRPHLIRAWQTSPLAQASCAENIVCELWENQPETALRLDTPEGMLTQRVTSWLTQQLTLLTDMNDLTYDDFIRHAQHQGWAPAADGERYE